MITLTKKNGAVDLSKKMMKGDDGGYYVPSVDAEGNLTWVPSEEEMPAVDAANIAGPVGPRGESGVYVGPEEPDESILVWVNTKSETVDELATKGYVDEAIKNVEVDVDLTDYYTAEQVDEKIEQIELTPGPQGEPGQDGQDYVLTEEDKAEIANLVLASIPSGDEVSY